MLIKGGARGDAGGLAKHLENQQTNERAELLELRGVVANDLDGALREIDAVSSGTRSTRPFYHASINPEPGEPDLTDEQKAVAIDRLETALGLDGQPRAVVEHVKNGREHVHVVWSRIDLERMTAISDSHNFAKHEEVSRDLEREFGHKRVQGAHVEREGVERPTRTPTHAEMQQAERTGIDPREAKQQITALWRSTDSGKAFVAAVEEKGWAIAPGDRRDFVLVDPFGETHSLARRIDGAKAKDVRQRMADVDPASLPTVEQARAQMHERQIARDETRGLPAEPEIQAPAPTPATPITTTTVTREVRTEEVRRETHVPHHHGSNTSEEFSLVGKMLTHILGDVVMDFLTDHVVEQIGQELGSEAGEIAHQVAEAADTVSNIKETVEIVHEVVETKTHKSPAQDGVHVNVGRQSVRLVDYVATQTTPTPPARKNQSAADERYQRELAALERDAALYHMREDIAAGRGIEPALVSKLNADDISNIKAKGDAHLIELIEQQEKHRQRQRDDGGRERD